MIISKTQAQNLLKSGKAEHVGEMYRSETDKTFAVINRLDKQRTDHYVIGDGDLRTKKNPARRAVKRKTRATTQRAAESYVRRPSQITKRKPTRRLVVRRTKNLQSPRGVFPNPVKKGLTARPRKTRAALTDKTFHVQAATLKKDGSQQGPWVTLGVFPNEKRAKEYAKAYAAAYPQQWVRVTA